MPFIFTFRYDNTCHTISVLRSHSALMPYQNTKTRSETLMSLTNIFELISHKKNVLLEQSQVRVSNY